MADREKGFGVVEQDPDPSQGRCWSNRSRRSLAAPARTPSETRRADMPLPRCFLAHRQPGNTSHKADQSSRERSVLCTKLQVFRRRKGNLSGHLL